MINVTYNKKIKNFQDNGVPVFNSRLHQYYWRKAQEKKQAILNIKSVSVQVKDIKMMLYSNSVPLHRFYSKFQFMMLNNDLHYNDEDYITILKRGDLNKSLIYAIITADWLINSSDIENKTINDITEECTKLQKESITLMNYHKDNTLYRHSGTINRIKLLQYKLYCLKEYCSKKYNTYQIYDSYDNICIKKKVRNINDN